MMRLRTCQLKDIERGHTLNYRYWMDDMVIAKKEIPGTEPAGCTNFPCLFPIAIPNIL